MYMSLAVLQGLKCAGTRRYWVLALLRKAWDSTGLSCTKCGKLILRKGIKIAATRCHILQLKCTKFDFGWGSTPDPAGRAYSAPPDPLAGFRVPTSNGKWGREGGWEGKGAGVRGGGMGWGTEGRGRKGGEGKRGEGREGEGSTATSFFTL